MSKEGLGCYFIKTCMYTVYAGEFFRLRSKQGMLHFYLCCVYLLLWIISIIFHVLHTQVLSHGSSHCTRHSDSWVTLDFNRDKRKFENVQGCKLLVPWRRNSHLFCFKLCGYTLYFIILKWFFLRRLSYAMSFIIIWALHDGTLLNNWNKDNLEPPF